MNASRTEFIGPGTGFAILCVLTGFAAFWLSTRGVQALQPAKQVLPALEQTTDLKRFRADAWYLPDEPMLGFVAIPAGSFVMGSSPEVDELAFANERWSSQSFQGMVELPAFFIGRYEVTVAAFRAFVEAADYKINLEAIRGDPTKPIASISWTDALAYSRWLSATLAQAEQTPTQLKALLQNGWRISLPTEAQWESAARGADGRIYPWGNVPMRAYANYQSPGTVAVGSLSCVGCTHSLSDMSGNVWEMTRSVSGSYPYDDRKKGEIGSDALFVMRGGSYNDAVNNVRTAVRGGIDPGARSPFVGFRVVISKAD